MSDHWLEPNDPIVGITLELVIAIDEKGQPRFGTGKIEDEKEIEAVQYILQSLEPYPAIFAAKPMGRIDLQLKSGAQLTLRPIFHPAYNEYRDLLKIDHLDCPMPDSFAALLNEWRKELARSDFKAG